ncbi:unnamed protein product [Gongylonema pulchrum]|uniref:Retrotransposon protein ty3-gypsy sub-class n=1 Tax=Gongylonema pulchrum TaxID=637853 RepID=A0A183E6V5_9BILA|nr:unnamed protein product [Gongylonema pulchrum]
MNCRWNTKSSWNEEGIHTPHMLALLDCQPATEIFGALQAGEKKPESTGELEQRLHFLGFKNSSIQEELDTKTKTEIQYRISSKECCEQPHQRLLKFVFVPSRMKVAERGRKAFD